MATIKYNYYENTTTGKHSWYARPKFGNTLTMEDLLEEALDGKSIEPTVARAAIEEFKKVVKREVLRGNRCNLGDDFLTLYPNIQLSVKDYTDKNGNLIVAKPEMLDARNAVSRIGCQVSSRFSKEFAISVKWVKESKETTAPTDDDATQGNENVETPVDTSTNDTSTNNSGGDDIPAGNG
jgi:hypothetical protein